ncbi:hypothetical protein HK104_008567, partial [Borealophlyctis nickersoniae]
MSWQQNNTRPTSQQWNPTPPASPQHGTQGWSSGSQPSQGASAGWSSTSGGTTSWDQSAPARQSDSWNSAPGFATNPHPPPTRPHHRHRARSYGGIDAFKADGWDSVPGWSSRPENAPGWNGASAAVPPAGGWSQVQQPATPQPQQQQLPGWGAPPNHIGGPPPPTSSQPAKRGAGWSPAGWDPLPPPRETQTASGWDGKRPGTSQPASAQTPQQSQPLAAQQVRQVGVQAAPASQPLVATADKAVNVSTTDVRGGPAKGPRRGSVVRISGGPVPPTTNTAATSNGASGAPRTNTENRPPPTAMDNRGGLRKARSAYVLSAGGRGPQANGAGRQPQLKGGDGNAKPDGQQGGKPRSRSKAPAGKVDAAAATGAKDKDAPATPASPTNPSTTEGGAAEDGARRVTKPSSRLFTRQMEEVNRTLGVSKDAKDALPAAAVVATQKEGSQENRMRRKKSVAKVTTKDVSKSFGLYIYGFPKWVRVREIMEIFSDFGAIVNVGIVTRPKHHERAYAYVDYETAGCAQKAVEALKEKKFFEMADPLELRPHFDNKNAERDDQGQPSQGQQSRNAKGRRGSKDKDAKKDEAKEKDVRKDEKEEKEKDGKEEKAKEDAESGVDYRTLHIGNVPQNVDKAELDKLFSPYGDIRRIHLVSRPKEKRAFGFVSYRDPKSAKKALAGIKDNKYFDMAEPLKAEYSRLEKKDRRKPVDKPWKKGEALKGDGDGKKRRERRERVARAVVLVRDVPGGGATVDAEAVKTKFAEYGNVKSVHVLPRAEGGNVAPHVIVVFEKGEDAGKAVGARAWGAVFPRQRRVHVNAVSATLVEADVRSFLAESGEVKRVEIPAVGTTATEDGKVTALVEFARGDDAAKGLVKLLENDFAAAGGRVQAVYAPSTKKEDGKEAAKDGEKDETKGDEEDDEDEEEKKEGDDDDDSSSSDEDEEVEKKEEAVSSPVTASPSPTEPAVPAVVATAAEEAVVPAHVGSADNAATPAAAVEAKAEAKEEAVVPAPVASEE